MNPATVFTIINWIATPIWAIWILAPRSGVSRALAAWLWPVQYCRGPVAVAV